jgi:hypothetical protein
VAIIKNFGFLWERQYINRGTGGAGKSGSLEGYRHGAKDMDVDFREQIGVYALYDENRAIVYVGQAGNGNATLFARLKQHMKGSNLWNRWTYFSWVGFKGVLGNGALSQKQSESARVGGFRYSDALNEIEGILIEFIEPKLNKQGGKLKNAVEYYQTTPDEHVTMENLKNDIDSLKNLIKASHKIAK